MKREIIVNSSMVETRVAVLEDGQLVELMIGDVKKEGFAGNIYKGRVLKILPGMQAAFVDVGLDKDAFLFVRDIYEDLEEYERVLTAGEEEFEGEERVVPLLSSKRAPRGGQPSIEELLKEGQEVLVQVAREPLGTKGARITSHITLPGRFLVYMPTEQHIGISRKIENTDSKAESLAWMYRLLLSIFRINWFDLEMLERNKRASLIPAGSSEGLLIRLPEAISCWTLKRFSVIRNMFCKELACCAWLVTRVTIPVSLY